MTAPSADLSRLLRPRSIAVVGGLEASEVIRQCRKAGFSGKLYAVNPKLETMEGLPCLASVADLPEPPDACFIGVNRRLTIEVVRALSAMGAGGAVCYASGFRESGGEGEALNEALLAAAGDLPILGPNCYGLINYMEGAALWPDQHGGKPEERGVAILAQSGNMAINFTMSRRGLPLAFVAALGNQAQIGLSAMTEALAEDERITAIGLHIEGIGHPDRFARALLKARARGIPVVALKTGKSEAGSALAMSHTASLAGGGAAMDAFLSRLGVPQLPSVPAFLETLKLLHVHGVLPGRDIASMSCSGGEASLMADSIVGRRLSFRALTPAQHDRIKATLSELVAVSNPLDYHTFIWAQEERLVETFSAMMQAGFDLTCLVIDFPREDRCLSRDWEVTTRAFAKAAKQSGARGALVASLAESLPERVAAEMSAQGVASFGGFEEALLAAEAAADIGEAWSRPAPELAEIPPLKEGTARSLSEWNAKRLLAREGLPLPEGGLAASAADAVAMAEELGYPLVVKAVANDLSHKSELGAVRLNLVDADQVAEAAEALLPLGKGLLVERMVSDGVCEIIAGIQRDPVVGPCLLVGSGGVLVELLADSKLLVLPASRAELGEALDGLKAGKLLAGYRGKPQGDREALLDALEAIQRFALAEAGNLLELDVNPIIVRPEGKGVVAVDALIKQIV
ncbi:acetate--CoA ligase family protein [Limibacillus halophilus]